MSYRTLAKKHNFSRSTLMRRHKDRAAPHEQKAENPRILHPRDEAELVEYIRGLTERHLMPTRHMIANFAAHVCGWEPSDNWVTRFLHRHSDTLLTAWSTPWTLCITRLVLVRNTSNTLHILIANYPMLNHLKLAPALQDSAELSTSKSSAYICLCK